ncbi:hypothetical protein BCR32DRAFT_301816 [Anaeromyces robustus]|uniref:Coth-domain-containing protein n=1 Tax=Anaeromyces robustus TaxID=1754192 RepID=A0A1Y1WYN9_9FUNG|nr:hypothetical protein BCR32DRAFT_301816 [Anaeromyces robustus]|eukprot:ORX78306.1 hypothetical protein BCR32DRAFT_301816 [Anaeromyces robustus]
MRIINYLFILLSLTLVSSKKTDEEDTNLPQFSLNSGFYNNDSIELEIKTKDPNAIIYYTLDGTIPTENSTIYEKPLLLKNKSLEENVLCNFNVSGKHFIPSIKVNKGNVIRAVAKLSNDELTNVVNNLFDYENGIYVLGKDYDDWIKVDPSRVNTPYYSTTENFNRKGRKYEKPATIEYFPSNKTEVTFSQDVGIRLKGRASRTYYQKSFRFVAREEYGGKKNIKYEIIPGNLRSDGKGPVNKYKSFSLRNAGNDSEYAKMRDIVLQELIKNDYFETQQTDFAIAFVDGEYWGIYDVYEEYNDNYIANNYDIDNNNVIVVKSGFPTTIESGEEEDMQYYKNITNFILNNDLSIQSNYDKVSNQWDVIGYAWYAAFYVYTDVIDGYYYQDGNWAMWRVREPDSSVPKADGKWRMMMYDTEYSTGMYNEALDFTRDVLKDIVNPKTTNRKIMGSTNAKITRSLLNNKEFKNRFINALCDMKNVHFEINRVQNLIDEKENLLLPMIEEHILRNGPIGDLDDPIGKFKEKVNNFRNYMKERYGLFMEMIQKDFGFESALDVTITANDFSKGSFIVNEMNEFNKSYTGEYFKENILYITAKPNEGCKLKSWVVKNCKCISHNPNTIGIYPIKKGCIVTANFN